MSKIDQLLERFDNHTVDNDKYQIYSIYQELNDILIDMPHIPNRCLEVLLLGLENSFYLIRFTALEPLEVHHEQTPIQVIVKVSNEDVNSWVRGEASYVLACTGYKRFIPLLEKNLKYKRGVEKIHILIGLIKLGEKQYFSSLLKTFDYINNSWFLILINLVIAESSIFNAQQKSEILKKLRSLLQENSGNNLAKREVIKKAVLAFNKG